MTTRLVQAIHRFHMIEFPLFTTENFTVKFQSSWINVEANEYMMRAKAVTILLVVTWVIRKKLNKVFNPLQK